MTKRENLVTRDALPVEAGLHWFARLLGTPREQLLFAVDWVGQSSLTLSLEDCAQSLLGSARQAGKEMPKAKQLLTAFFRLEEIRSAFDWNGDYFVEFLSTEAVDHELIKPEASELEAVKSALTSFFKYEPKLKLAAKAQKIYDGLIANFDSCWSLVEFRPVFNTERTEIYAGVISASLSLRVREVNGSPEDYTTFSFQLDGADAVKLMDELNAIKSKIALLRDFPTKDIHLLNSKASLLVKQEIQNV